MIGCLSFLSFLLGSWCLLYAGISIGVNVTKVEWIVPAWIIALNLVAGLGNVGVLAINTATAGRA